MDARTTGAEVAPIAVAVLTDEDAGAPFANSEESGLAPARPVYDVKTRTRARRAMITFSKPGRHA